MRALAVFGAMMMRAFLKLLTITVLAFEPGFPFECVSSKRGPEEVTARLKELGEKAQQEVERKEFAQAARDLREAICLAPQNATLHLGLGVVEAAAGNMIPAREEFEKADRLAPDNHRPLAMMVNVNLAAGETEKVKESLRAVAKRFPLDGELHAELSRELLRYKQNDLALAESLRAEQSGSREAIGTLAALEYMAGAHRDAVRHAVAMEGYANFSDRARASAAGIAGLSFEALGRRGESMHHLRLAIQLAPALEESYLSLARILQVDKKYKEAAQVLEEGQKYLPNSASVMLALGSNLVLAGEGPKGSHILTELTRRFPDQAEAYVQLAEFYREKGEHQLAIQILQQLAQRKPDYPMLHVMIAQSMLAGSAIDYPAALEELAQAEKISPTDADTYYLRGKIYAAANRYSDAVDALRRAVALRPTDPRIYYQLGLAYQRLGEHSLAREQFERMEHLKPRSSSQ